MALRNPPEQEILSSLSSGLRAEIRFDVRVYEKATGFFGFLGDKLVGENRTVYEAQWDEFGNEFLVTASNHSIYTFRTAPSFLAFFFALKSHETGIAVPSRGSLYMLTNVGVNAVRLVPPLNMILLFFRSQNESTPWERTPLTF